MRALVLILSVLLAASGVGFLVWRHYEGREEAPLAGPVEPAARQAAPLEFDSAEEFFDAFVVSEDPDDPSRADGEVLRLVSSGLKRAGVAPANMQVVPTLNEAIDVAFDMVKPGDLLLLTGGPHHRTWEHLDRFGLESRSDQPVIA